MSNGPVLALDIGGSTISAGLVEDGALRRHVRRDTGDPWATVREVLDVVRGGDRVRGVGIACSGPVDPVAGTVSPINIDAWDGFALRSAVGETVPDVPVRLAGDAVCMALGEARHGAGRGVTDLLGVVVSTGVGGGVISGGRPLHGRTGNAGHVGHVVVEPDGSPCGCGGRGCLETVVSGPALVRRARSRGWVGTDTVALVTAARDADPVAGAVFRSGGLALGRALASVAAVCDLDLVLLGGGVAAAGDLLLLPAREAIATHARLAYLRGLRVIPGSLGAHAGLLGAAALVTG